MKIILRIVLVFILMTTVVGCGSKKKIVTKKKHDKTEKVVAKNKDSEPLVNPTETPVTTVPVVTAPNPSGTMNITESYISEFSPIAQKKMREHKIPASITLAQGILESASGRGRLAVEGNNHFGIKCHGWSGGKIFHDDDVSQECFRKYKHAEQSFEDHSEFLTSRGRYAKLFDLDVDDYQGWAKGLRAAGYATDRKYPDKLISLIERFQLYRFDQEVLGTTASTSRKKDLGARLTHKVQKGDTMYSLSKRYNLSINELQKLNGMTNNNLQLGQILIVK